MFTPRTAIALLCLFLAGCGVQQQSVTVTFPANAYLNAPQGRPAMELDPNKKLVVRAVIAFDEEESVREDEVTTYGRVSRRRVTARLKRRATVEVTIDLPSVVSVLGKRAAGNKRRRAVQGYVKVRAVDVQTVERVAVVAPPAGDSSTGGGEP